MKKLILLILFIVFFASPVWALDATIYKFNSSAAVITAQTGDINGEALDTSTTTSIDAYVAAVEGATTTRAALASDPGGSYDASILVNTGTVIGVHSLFTSFNVRPTSLARMAVGGVRDGSFVHEEEGYVQFQNGSHEPVVGEIITGTTSGKTFIVVSVVETGAGSWGGNDQTGYIHYKTLDGALTDNEAIQDPGTTDVADIIDDEVPEYPAVGTGRFGALVNLMGVDVLNYGGGEHRFLWDVNNTYPTAADFHYDGEWGGSDADASCAADDVGPGSRDWLCCTGAGAGTCSRWKSLIRAKDLTRMVTIGDAEGFEIYFRGTTAGLDYSNTDASEYCTGSATPYDDCSGEDAGLDEMEMWDDAIKYIDDQGLSIEYINLGNEPTNAGRNIATGGEPYSNVTQEWITSFDAEKSGLKYGSPHIMSAPIKNWAGDGDDYDFAKEFMDDLTGDIGTNSLDIVAAHHYHSSSSGDDCTTNISGRLAYWSDHRWSTKYITDTYGPDLDSYRDTYHSNAATMLGEWGVMGRSCVAAGGLYWNGDEMLKSIGVALWTADVLGRAPRAGIDSVSFFELTNGDWHTQDCNELVPSDCSGGYWGHVAWPNTFSKVFPVTYVYIMLAQWWGDEWLTDVSSTDEGDVSVVASSSSSDAYKFWVMVINKSNVAKDVKVSLGGNYYYNMTAGGSGVLAANTIEIIYLDTTPDAVIDNEASFGGGAIIGGTASMGGS